MRSSGEFVFRGRKYAVWLNVCTLEIRFLDQQKLFKLGMTVVQNVDSKMKVSRYSL